MNDEQYVRLGVVRVPSTRCADNCVVGEGPKHLKESNDTIDSGQSEEKKRPRKK